MNLFYKKGIALAELVIVIAVLALIFSIALPQFSKIREKQALQNAGSDILSVLDKARSQTLASLNSSSYGVHFQSDKVIIFKGAVFSAGDANNEIINLAAPAGISGAALGCAPPVPCDVYFARLSGSPSATGTITISTPSFSKIITISAAGVVSLN